MEEHSYAAIPTKRGLSSPSGHTPNSKRQEEHSYAAIPTKRGLSSPSGHTPNSKRQVPADKAIADHVALARSVRKSLFEIPEEQVSGSGCSANNTKERTTAVEKDAGSDVQKPLFMDTQKTGIRNQPWSHGELGRLLELFNTVRNKNLLFFQDCASKLSEEFGTKRTGASCASKYFDTHRRLKNTHNKIQKSPSSASGSSSHTSHATAKPVNNFIPLSDVHIGKKSRQPSAAAEKLHTYTQRSCADPAATITQEENALLRAAMKMKSVAGLASHLFHIATLRMALWKLFLQEMREASLRMCKKKGSKLQHKQFCHLNTFSWETVLDELTEDNNLLLDTLLAYTIPAQKQHSGTLFDQLPTVLGMVYASIMKCRWNKLSLVQHVVSLMLVEEKVHQKVFDSLQPLGVCMSYQATLQTVGTLQQHIQTELVTHVKEGRRFRLVGDNVDFKVDVSHQRLSTTNKSTTTEHWFASAAIVQEVDFSHLPDVQPREDLISLPTACFMPQEEDWAGLKQEFVIIIIKALVEHLPAFRAFDKCWVDSATATHVPNLEKKQAVIPLSVLPKSEQKYSEVVDVLDYYETVLQDVHEEAQLPLQGSTKVQIGGDQLTRERFSGAKRLRCMADTPEKRFDHLHPITFEPFHLQMKILTTLYKVLYNEKSCETGTLGAEKIRLCRTKANGNEVTTHFNDCSELAVSLVNAYIVEAACEFFGIDRADKILPARYIDKPLTSLSSQDKMDWVQKNVGDLVDTLVWPHTRKHVDATEITANVDKTEVVVNMPDGSTKTVTIMQPLPQPQLSEAQQDDSFTYGQNVLELGLVYKAFAASIKAPNRCSMLKLLKYIMLILKGDNNRSKYSLEILRLLFHQLATLSEKTAHESFYGMFVNTQGKSDSHIAADMKMEHVVQHVKGHIRHLKANKSEKTIQKKTGAFAALDVIVRNFDEQTHVVARHGQGHTPSSHEDEVLLIQNLHRLRPF